MRGVARLGDETIGVCYCHETPINVSGIIATSSMDCFVNERGIARIGDTVQSECGHTGKIITGEVTRLINNLPLARIGDEFTGCYTGSIVTGSTDSF